MLLPMCRHVHHYMTGSPDVCQHISTSMKTKIYEKPLLNRRASYFTDENHHVNIQLLCRCNGSNIFAITDTYCLHRKCYIRMSPITIGQNVTESVHAYHRIHMNIDEIGYISSLQQRSNITTIQLDVSNIGSAFHVPYTLRQYY